MRVALPRETLESESEALTFIPCKQLTGRCPVIRRRLNTNCWVGFVCFTLRLRNNKQASRYRQWFSAQRYDLQTVQDKTKGRIHVFDWRAGFRFGYLLLRGAVAETSSYPEKGVIRMCLPYKCGLMFTECMLICSSRSPCRLSDFASVEVSIAVPLKSLVSSFLYYVLFFCFRCSSILHSAGTCHACSSRQQQARHMQVPYARGDVACGLTFTECMLICSPRSPCRLSDFASVEVSIALPLKNLVFGREDDLLGTSSVCFYNLSGHRSPLERAESRYGVSRFHAVDFWILC